MNAIDIAYIVSGLILVGLVAFVYFTKMDERPKSDSEFYDRQW